MDPFLGEIRAFPYNFAPQGWAFCNGQLLAISQSTALFSLLGTFYGGDGRSTFALPNLQGRIVVGIGNGSGNYAIGETGGVPSVTLADTTMPGHTHTIAGGAGINAKQPAPSPTTFLGATSSRSGGINVYAPPALQTANPTNMLPSNPAGGGQPHNNLAPFLGLSYCIALQGVFPPRS
jgi:microcystin-dependent protein